MGLLLIIDAGMSFKESNDQLVNYLCGVVECWPQCDSRQRAAAALSFKSEMTRYEMKNCRIVRYCHSAPLT